MSQIAERYALALYDVVNKQNKTEEAGDILAALADAIDTHDDIKAVLSSPLINSSDKVAVLKTAIGSDVSKELATFFDLLAKNNRIHLMPQIDQAYKEVVSKVSGTLTGEVSSATELTDQQKTDIQKTIEKELSRKVELKYLIKPDMIGGIEAKVGSYIFEDSIKSHMQKLNDHITRRVQ